MPKAPHFRRWGGDKVCRLIATARSLWARDVLAIHDAGRLEEFASAKPEILTIAASRLRSAAVNHRTLATVADTTADLLERALSRVSSGEAPAA